MSVPLVLMVIWMTTSPMDAQASKQPRQCGVASWYGAECKRTATGERYNCNDLTAAHRTLPIGTVVEVHNLANGRSVTVRINNRGPYCKGRILDLSKAAAQKLEMMKSGTAKVELVVLK